MIHWCKHNKGPKTAVFRTRELQIDRKLMSGDNWKWMQFYENPNQDKSACCNSPNVFLPSFCVVCFILNSPPPKDRTMQPSIKSLDKSAQILTPAVTHAHMHTDTAIRTDSPPKAKPSGIHLPFPTLNFCKFVLCFSPSIERHMLAWIYAQNSHWD